LKFGGVASESNAFRESFQLSILPLGTHYCARTKQLCPVILFGGIRPELTAFQIEAEKGINAVLEHLGDRRIAGVSETYISRSIKDQDITFWIYPDGAAFQVGRQMRRFERPDYEALADLGCKFIEEFTKAVQGRGTESKD
jgi:hypothetical protein